MILDGQSASELDAHPGHEDLAWPHQQENEEGHASLHAGLGGEGEQRGEEEEDGGEGGEFEEGMEEEVEDDEDDEKSVVSERATGKVPMTRFGSRFILE